MIAENGGIWAAWEEASGERHDAAALHSADRRDLFRELGLTLGHEMSNSLVSLAMLRHGDRESPPAPALLEAVRADISRLEGVNRNFGLMQTLHEAVAGPVDVRDVARSLGGKLGIRVEVGPDPVMLSISRELVEFALRSLIETVAENHPDGADRGLALQVRSTGEGVEHTVLLSLKGKNLELEGVLPEPTANAVPNQGRLGVFLAKEILRLHRGEIHAGPGMEGTEILISIRSF